MIIGAIFADPAFRADRTGLVSGIAQIDPTTGRVHGELIEVAELHPPQDPDAIVAAIAGMETAVLRRCRGANLFIGCDATGSGAAMSAPILGRYEPRQTRLVRWIGGDTNGSPVSEPIGVVRGRQTYAPVWPVSRLRSFAEAEPFISKSLKISETVSAEGRQALAEAMRATATKQSRGHLTPDSAGAESDDALSALVGWIAIVSHTINWSALFNQNIVQRPKFNSSAWT